VRRVVGAGAGTAPAAGGAAAGAGQGLRRGGTQGVGPVPLLYPGRGIRLVEGDLRAVEPVVRHPVQLLRHVIIVDRLTPSCFRPGLSAGYQGRYSPPGGSSHTT